MELSKRHKMMMLFLNGQNPVLQRLQALKEGRKAASVSEDSVQEMCGVSRQTPKNWREGRDMRSSKADGVCPTALTYLDRAAANARAAHRCDEREVQDLRRRVEEFGAAYQRGDMNLYDIADLLGMSTKECQQAIDAAIYDVWPLLPSVYAPAAPKFKSDPDPSQKECDLYEGVYLLWLRRDTVWLQCPLRVRYLQPGGRGRFIRCKMNFPVIGQTDGPGYGEYDGFLVLRERSLYFTFERREFERHDFFHFIVSAESHTGMKNMTLTGQYLTTGQDDKQTVVTGPALLHRLFSDAADLRHLHYREIMWNEAKVLKSDAKVQDAEERWEQYGGDKAMGLVG